MTLYPVVVARRKRQQPSSVAYAQPVNGTHGTRPPPTLETAGTKCMWSYQWLSFFHWTRRLTTHRCASSVVYAKRLTNSASTRDRKLICDYRPLLLYRQQRGLTVTYTRSKNFDKRPNRRQKFTDEEDRTARKSHCGRIAAERRQCNIYRRVGPCSHRGRSAVYGATGCDALE